ncbi:hypothetical protein HDE_12823 [Halotydeus destructor]|nr:hypothetical protein HDE_12823 [Halotydeus destructor]
MSSNRSLCDLNDDIIGHVIYVARHIWDVLNLTATSRRLNTLCERHLKKTKYLDVRIPYVADTESAEIIEKGIKQLCLQRCGSRLTEIKILKPHQYNRDTEFLRSLGVLPQTLMKLIDDGARLASLKNKLVSNEDTIAKQRRIAMSTHRMSILSALVDESDSSVTTGLQRDFSAVTRLDIIFSEHAFETNRIAKCFTLFPNLEALAIQVKQKKLFKLIQDNCPNFKNVNLDFCDNSEDRILDFFENFGHLLETATIYYFEGGRLSFDMFKVILNQCPKLKRFESNGILTEEIEKYEELYGRFLQTPHLADVTLLMGLEPETPPATTLLYLNGKMASIDGTYFKIDVSLAFAIPIGLE